MPQPAGRALFALSPSVKTEGDLVIRSGKFFQCDTPFVDMNGTTFSLSTAEADRILPGFTGGNINIEHMPTLFDGHLGTVRRTWRENADVMAEYAIPSWLHEVTKGEPLKISSEWDVASKQPLGAALVLNPAVVDAAMMAAFAAAKLSPEMQQHHDMACRQGAECPGKAMFAEPSVVAMMTPATLAAVQSVHDLAAANGASCDVYKTKQGSMYYAAPALPTGDTGKGPNLMFEKLKALFRHTGATPAEIDAAIAEATAASTPTIPGVLTPPAPAPTANFAEAPEFKAVMAQMNALTQANADLVASFAEERKQANFAAADAQLSALVAERRVDPAEAEGNPDKGIPGLRGMIRSNYAAFSAMLPILQARQPRFQSFRAPSAPRLDSTDPGAQLVAMATAMHKADPKRSLTACMAAVAEQNPELARANNAQVPVIAKGE